MRIRSLNTIGFNFLPTSSISGWVSGTNPQLCDQESLRIARMIAASRSNCDLSTSRMTMRTLRSHDWMTRLTIGGNYWVMSRQSGREEVCNNVNNEQIVC